MDNFNKNLIQKAWKYEVSFVSLLCNIIDMETTSMSFVKPFRIFVQLAAVITLGYLAQLAYQFISASYVILNLLNLINQS